MKFIEVGKKIINLEKVVCIDLTASGTVCIQTESANNGELYFYGDEAEALRAFLGGDYFDCRAIKN